MSRTGKRLTTALIAVAFGTLGFGTAHLTIPPPAIADVCGDEACGGNGICGEAFGHFCWELNGTSEPCTGTSHCYE